VKCRTGRRPKKSFSSRKRSSTSSFATEVAVDKTRCVVVASPERWRSDTARTAELVKRTVEKLAALEWRVRHDELADPGKIGRAAQRILGASGVARLFRLEIGEGQFVYDYDPRSATPSRLRR
jgi:hypothetical protein